MQKGGNGGWTFHGVGQPDMERKLGGFPQTSTEQSQPHRRHHPAAGRGGHTAGQIGKLEGSEKRPSPQNPENESKIPDTIDQKRLVRSRSRCRTIHPETNEQIGT